MLDVKVFKSTRKSEKFRPIVSTLAEHGIRVWTWPQPADVSFVLGGGFENPCIFHGKKVLFFRSNEWGPQEEWKYVYRPILEEYYDEFVDITGMDYYEITEKILEHKAKYDNSGTTELRGSEETDSLHEQPQPAE